MKLCAAAVYCLCGFFFNRYTNLAALVCFVNIQISLNALIGKTKGFLCFTTYCFMSVPRN